MLLQLSMSSWQFNSYTLKKPGWGLMIFVVVITKNYLILTTIHFSAFKKRFCIWRRFWCSEPCLITVTTINFCQSHLNVFSAKLLSLSEQSYQIFDIIKIKTFYTKCYFFQTFLDVFFSNSFLDFYFLSQVSAYLIKFKNVLHYHMQKIPISSKTKIVMFY